MDGSARPPQTDDVELPPTGEYALVPQYDSGTYAGATEPASITLPRISDYWPDQDKPRSAPAPEPDRPERRFPLRLMAMTAAVLAVLGVSGVVVTRLVSDDSAAPPPVVAPDPEIIVGAAPSAPVSIEPAPSAEATTPSAPASPPAATSATPPPPAGPAFEAGTFVLASGLTEINVSLGRPPRDGIAKVSSPDGSGVKPDAKLDGTELRLTAERTSESGTGDVSVVLDERITWTIRMDAGVRKGVFDLAAGSVRDLVFDGGANRLELTLPRQEREIEIRMTGGVREWRIGTEGEFRVKVRVRKGAGEISLNGDRDEGVDKGEVVRSRGNDEKSGGLTIEAVGGIGSLKVSPL